MRNLTKILFFLAVVSFFACGCEENEKEEWLEIDLNETDCYFNGTIIDTVTNYLGYIHNYPGTESWVINGNDFNFFPCNLASKYNEEGMEIIFDGEVMNVIDYIEGGTQDDMPGTPIRLTYAKIRLK